MNPETLKMLLGITGTDKDLLIQFTIEDVTETILNYCNLSTLPNGLINTAYRMAMDLYRNECLGSADATQGPVSSISEGDTTTSWRAGDTTFTNGLLKNYSVQLNKYRRLSWT